MRCRKDCYMFQFVLHFSCQNINLWDPVYLVSKEFHTNCCITLICRNDFQNISTHTKCTTVEIHIITIILDLNQLCHYFITIFDHTRTQRNYHVLVIYRVTQPINTRHTGNNDHISPLHQWHSCGESKLINLVIDGRILGNICVWRWNICFRLIIVVVGDKIFHCVIRKELFEFPIQLRSQRLIMCNNQCRLVHLLNDIRHGKCLTRSSNSKQRLTLVSFFETFDQLSNYLRLVASWVVLWY